MSLLKVVLQAEHFLHGDISIKTGDVITKYVSKAMGRLKLSLLKLEIFLHVKPSVVFVENVMV